jgi:hypothetical protein
VVEAAPHIGPPEQRQRTQQNDDAGEPPKQRGCTPNGLACLPALRPGRICVFCHGVQALPAHRVTTGK